MISGELARPVPPGQETGRRGVEGWPAMLRRWLVECPRRAQVWLAVGARENDRHVCKECNHGFVISRGAARDKRSDAAGGGNT
jgi:hypothetical protein